MKRLVLIPICMFLLLAPWLALYQNVYGARAGEVCSAESEVLVIGEGQQRIRSKGLLTYRFESFDRALLRFVGELQVGTAQSPHKYTLHRTAEVTLAIVGNQVISRTLGASRWYSDDAPDELAYRYAHPALQPHSHYHARLYRLPSGQIATGTDTAPRNICRITPAA